MSKVISAEYSPHLYKLSSRHLNLWSNFSFWCSAIVEEDAEVFNGGHLLQWIFGHWRSFVVWKGHFLWDQIHGVGRCGWTFLNLCSNFNIDFLPLQEYSKLRERGLWRNEKKNYHRNPGLSVLDQNSKNVTQHFEASHISVVLVKSSKPGFCYNGHKCSASLTGAHEVGHWDNPPPRP